MFIQSEQALQPGCSFFQQAGYGVLLQSLHLESFPAGKTIVDRSLTSWLLALMTALWLPGCRQQQAVQDLQEPAGEQWFLVLLNGERIGWGHQSEERIQRDGTPLVVTRQQVQMAIRRGEEITRQQLQLETTTTVSGELRDFSQTETSGPSTTTITGRLVPGGLSIERGTTTTTIPWNPEQGGFFSVTRSLLQSPLHAGETRTVTELTPQVLQASDVVLTALKEESVVTPGGIKQLLKVRRTDPLPTGELVSWMWIDSQGTVHAVRIEGIELWQFLATRELAEQPLEDPSGDLLGALMVPVNQPLENPRQARQVRYQLHLERPVTPALSNDSFQTVTRLDRQTYQIDVHPPGPASVLEQQPLEPDDGHLASSAMIQSGDPAISRQAARILPETEDRWQLALALEKHVHMLIDRKDYSQAFASALDVLESRQGDCTEHAVLLAALCRAREIPTRIAVGLVYVPGNSPGYGYHMWNEVWIGDRWIGLDATAAGGRTGADRIKILDTRLGDAEAHLPLASLLSWIGQGRLEILAAR